MGNHKFRLTSIIPKLWLSNRRAATPKSPKTHISRCRLPQPVSKTGQLISKEALPLKSFDEMLLLSSSSRSFSTERVLQKETEHTLLPQPIVTQPRRASVYESSNAEESPRRRKFQSKCCQHGTRLRVKSPRINGLVRRSTSISTIASSTSCSSSFGSDKRRGLLESSVMVVKSSANPERHFKESMVEMIVENKINHVEGLEELLVSYLMLNSDEFHDVIVSVFKQILTALYRKQNKFLD